MKLLRAAKTRVAALAMRALPSSLFGRLALLLFVVVLASHALVLTVMVEFHPWPGFDGPPPSFEAGQGAASGTRADPGTRPPQPPGTFAHGPGGMPIDAGMLFDIGVRLTALLFAAWIGARWLSEPVQRLADAARDLGGDINRLPLAEAGTTECREATRVFNGMQARIQRQIADRDRFVAAVSHDLRTPLTRLRLRAESLPDEEDRSSFRRDIAEMDAMIRDTLDYLLGVAQAEASVRLDVEALVCSFADDHADAGLPGSIAVSGSAAPMFGQPGALRRCIGNLIENALRYGGDAEIMLKDTPQALSIAIADRGPGLAPEELENVTKAFYRVESSRNRHSGGVGLGLSIAQEIAQRHGGKLLLSNREGGGLIAELQFARNAAA
ncbi:two-component sensor histidine kinase [Xylophilus rhododendri]|uniref:histidine kinase n=1 Tax=Xylophilus rhododendri TaxID=2697032 RepID=A0A857JAV0_9BURK|nr:ATP-binding protein [Xylophilus rhododendri]QHJ00272.1 two-component sensor histidine kinase [Xylophilus rhododendri]